MLLKQHIQNDPCLRMRLLEQSVNLRVDDIDLHFQCKKQIADLQDKLKFREQKLAETTCSYLKDLSNVREQLYRQANAGQEYYEVQYFDSFEIGDPKYMNLLNTKLGQVKAQFDQKTKYLCQVIEAQKKEASTLNRELQELQVKYGYFANPEYLLRKLLYLERDPYKIWKLIQENAGNPHFFQVFQLQKKGYGIDYREIDKLLLSSQSQDREFQSYKEGLNTQIVQFMERVLNEAQMLRDQIEEQQSEIDGYKRHQKKYRMIIQHQVDKVISYVFRQYNSLLLKIALKKWQQKDKLSDFLIQISEFKLAIQQQQVTDYLIFDISQLQDKVSMLQNQLVNQKFINKQLELRKDIMENCVNSVQKVLNIKVGTIEFETKLLKLDNFQIRHSTELVQKLEQLGQTYARYVTHFKKESKYVQTDYCNPQLLDKELINLITIETDKQLQQFCQNCMNQSHHTQINNSPQKQLKNSEKKETIFSRARTPIMKNQTDMVSQPHHQNSIYIEREYLQQAMLSPKSNLINLRNVGNELPKLRRQSQVRKELKKQLQGLRNLSFQAGSDSEVDRSRNNTYRKGLRKRPQIIIQYQQYPEEDILKNIS